MGRLAEMGYSDNPEGRFSSSLVSRNITIMGRRTSVRLEPEMWMAIREIARREKCTIHDICSLIFLRKHKNTSLTAANPQERLKMAQALYAIM